MGIKSRLKKIYPNYNFFHRLYIVVFFIGSCNFSLSLFLMNNLKEISFYNFLLFIINLIILFVSTKYLINFERYVK